MNLARYHAWMRFWLILLLLICGTASAQPIVTVNGLPGSANLIHVDPATGAMRLVAFGDGPQPTPSVGALDAGNRRLFFMREGRLESFDLRRETTRDVGYRGYYMLHELAWDAASQRILSVVGYPILVIAIDPTDGQSVTLTTLPAEYSGIAVNICAFDARHRRLFFEIGNGDPELLATFDVASGVTRVTRLSGNGHLFLRYDPLSDRLLTYGIGAGCRPEIRAIDLPTGVEEPLAIVPDDLADAMIQISAFDVIGRRLFYLSGFDFGHPRLVTFDLERRSFQSVPFPVSGVVSAFEFAEHLPRDRQDPDHRVTLK